MSLCYASQWNNTLTLLELELQLDIAYLTLSAATYSMLTMLLVSDCIIADSQAACILYTYPQNTVWRFLYYVADLPNNATISRATT